MKVFVNKGLIVAFLFTLLFFGCSTAPFGGSSESELEFVRSTLKQNNFKKLEEYLKNNKISSSAASCGLNESLQETRNDKICRSEINELLLKSAAVPTEQRIIKSSTGTDLIGNVISLVEKVSSQSNELCERSLNYTNTMQSGCKETVKLIIPKLANSEISFAIDKNSIDIPKPIFDGDSITNEVLRENVKQLYQATIDHLKLVCSSKGQASKECSPQESSSATDKIEKILKADEINLVKLKKDIEDGKLLAAQNLQKAKLEEEQALKQGKAAAIAYEKKRKAAMEYQASPDRIKERYCEEYKGYLYFTKALQKESEVERESGVTNLTNKDKLARMKILSRDAVANLAKKYKDSTAQDLRGADCPGTQ